MTSQVRTSSIQRRPGLAPSTPAAVIHAPVAALSPRAKRRRAWFVAALIFLLGCALRIVPWTAFDGLGYDASWYRKYVLALDQHGLGVYPEICAAYLEDGRDEATLAKVPPMRVLFVVSAWAWKRIAFSDTPPADLNAPGGIAADAALNALHHASIFYSCLLLVAVWGFARRLVGEVRALGVLALVACSPLLLHMSQHALIDGVMACCALFGLWALWESLQQGASARWLALFAVCCALVVLVKENALFVGVGFAAVMFFARPLGLAPATSRHWLAAALGGVLGIAVITWTTGGLWPAFEAYQLIVRKASALEYAHRTGAGPWSRYLIDLMILTPATLCCALGGAFRSLREDRRVLPLLLFLVASYVVMCNVRYGMNLRYTTIWDFPLRVLAVVAVASLSAKARRPVFAFAAAIALLCAVDLAQYQQFFVQHRLYELPTADLLRAEGVMQ